MIDILIDLFFGQCDKSIEMAVSIIDQGEELMAVTFNKLFFILRLKDGEPVFFSGRYQ